MHKYWGRVIPKAWTQVFRASWKMSNPFNWSMFRRGHKLIFRKITLNTVHNTFEDIRISESPESWYWTGKSGMLQSMGSQRVGHHWATELNWESLKLVDRWRNVSGQWHIVQKNQRSFSISPLIWLPFFFCFFFFFFACDFCHSLHIPTQTNILKMDQNFYKLLENCVAFSFLLNMLQNKNNNENQHMHIMYNTMTGELSIHYAGLKETDSLSHTHTHGTKSIRNWV